MNVDAGSRAPVPRLVRFAFTGAAGVVVDFSALVLLHSGMRVPLLVATPLAYALAGTVHYSLTRWWVFPDRSDDGSELAKLARYVVLAALNAAATALAVTGMAAVGLDFRVAKAVTVLMLFAVNYVVIPRTITSWRRT